MEGKKIWGLENLLKIKLETGNGRKKRERSYYLYILAGFRVFLRKRQKSKSLQGKKYNVTWKSKNIKAKKNTNQRNLYRFTSTLLYIITTNVPLNAPFHERSLYRC